MRRRDFITLIGGGAATWPLAARAQQPQQPQQPTMPVVGYLNSGSPEPIAHLMGVFRQSLAATGYVEGRNVVVEYRWAEGHYDRMPAMAEELVRWPVDVIVASPNPPALVAKAATTTIPIVFGVTDDPVGLGLVNSIARPHFFFRRMQFATLATRHALPAIYTVREYPEAGCLMSYGTSLAEVFRQHGNYVGRILKGAKPSDLPVVQSTKFDFVINLTTAKALGLNVPPSLLARADEVIE